MDKNLEKTGTGLAELSIRDLKYLNTKGTSVRKKYSSEFKTEIVQSYLNGKTRKSIIDEYNIPPSTLHSWVREYKTLLLREKENSQETNSDLLEPNNNIKEKIISDDNRELQRLLSENERLKKVIQMLLNI